MKRDNGSDRRPLVIDGDTAGTLLTTKDFEFGVEPGFRTLLGYRANQDSAYEVSYFGIFNWNAGATVVGDDNLALPGDLGLASTDFLDADRMRLNYDTQLHNFEANYVRSLEEFSLLAGFRFLSLDERFNIQSTDSDGGTSDYHVRTRNRLYGGQVGMRLQGTHGRIAWDATGKAGIFGNDADQSQSVTDFPPGFFLREKRSSSGVNVAFVGDLNGSLSYRLTDVWSVRTGYQILWVEGVALAPNQLDFTDTPTSRTSLQNSAGLFMHGANVGLEARW